MKNSSPTSLRNSKKPVPTFWSNLLGVTYEIFSSFFIIFIPVHIFPEKDMRKMREIEIKLKKKKYLKMRKICLNKLFSIFIFSCPRPTAILRYRHHNCHNSSGARYHARMSDREVNVDIHIFPFSICQNEMVSEYWVSDGRGRGEV